MEMGSGVVVETENARTPSDIREGVRSGILIAVERDVEQRGGRTARLLGAAGLAGGLAATGITLIVSSHPFDHHPTWHMVAFSAIWAGLLVACFAMTFLNVRTPTLPLARSALTGMLGLGLAGICAAVCPDQHFLGWWSGTAMGAPLTRIGGFALSAVCFGLSTAFFVSLISAFLTLGDARRPVKPLLPAAAILILMLPGIALQSVGGSASAFFGWLVGAAAGAYLGVAGGSLLRARLAPPRAE